MRVWKKKHDERISYYGIHVFLCGKLKRAEVEARCERPSSSFYMCPFKGPSGTIPEQQYRLKLLTFIQCDGYFCSDPLNKLNNCYSCLQFISPVRNMNGMVMVMGGSRTFVFMYFNNAIQTFILFIFILSDSQTICLI